MRLCCELCGNVPTDTYKAWLEHLTSETHQQNIQSDVWSWEEEANIRSLVVTGMPKEGGIFKEVPLPPFTVAWHFSRYGIISNIFVHPNQKFFIVQFERRELSLKALRTDACEVEGIAIILRPKQDLSPADWFTLSSCTRIDDEVSPATAPDDLLEAKQLWYFEQMLNLQADMQLEKFISLATMSADDFSSREKIRSDLSLLVKREYGNAKLQGVGDVITGLGDSESTLIVHVDVLGASRNPLQHKHDDWYSPTSFVDAIYRMMMASSKSSEPFCQDVVLIKEESEYISFTHYPSNVNVELQFESVIPVYSSKLIQFLISLDPRVLPLMLIIRYWTAYHIQPTNSISGYALELLIVTFLNNCKILPNVAFLQSKTTNKIPMVDNFWNVNFCTDYEEITKILAHSGKKPVEFSETTRKPTASSILLLASDFFKMYADVDFKNNIVCSLLGNMLSKDGFYVDNPNAPLPHLLQPYKNWALSKDSTLDIDSPLCIQDPFNLGKNIASKVTKIDLEKFQNACYTSITLFERLAEDATGVLPNFMDFASRKNRNDRDSNENECHQSRDTGVGRKRPWKWQRASETITGNIVEDDVVQIVTFVGSKSPNTNIPSHNNFRKNPAFENRQSDNNSRPKALLPTPLMNMPTRINFREEPLFESRPTSNFSKPKPLLPLPETNIHRHNNFREEPAFDNRHFRNYPEHDVPLERDMPVPNNYQEEEPVFEKRFRNDNYTEPNSLLQFPRRPNRDDPPERILRNPGDYRAPIEAQLSPPQSRSRFTPDFSIVRDVQTVFRSPKYNAGKQPLHINSPPIHLDNNRSPIIPGLMDEYRPSPEHQQFERGSRNRSITVLEREPFQNQRMEVVRGGRESRYSPNHPREHSGDGRRPSPSRPRTSNEKRRNQTVKPQTHKQLQEAVPVDGIETYELRIQHIVAPNFANCFNFMFSSLGTELEVEQKCTSLWSLFLRDYFTEIWETAFKLTAKICDPTIILDKLYSNRSNFHTRDSYSEGQLKRLHEKKATRHGEIDEEDDEDRRDLINVLCNRSQNGYFRDSHPHQDKFARLNYHEKFCISFLVGGCTEIFTAHALRHTTQRELRERMWNLSPLEKEGLVNQNVLERMRQKKRYREFIATAKVDLTKRPPELLTIFTETPDFPGMDEVFYNMTDIMKGCLSQYQNYRLERWLL